MNKQLLRPKMANLRRTLDASGRHRANIVISKKLLAMPEVLRARTICCYVSTPEEVDTKEIITHFLAQGKQVVVPKAEGNRLVLYQITALEDLVKGAFGILEPATTQQVTVSAVDVFIVPGFAFDQKGHRLGWGKGYYDRLLADVAAFKIGLAYSFQLVSRLETRVYDIPMDTVVTENEEPHAP